MKINKDISTDFYSQVKAVTFTGTQNGMTSKQKEIVRDLLIQMGPKLLIHGDCVGADEEAHEIAVALDIDIRKRPCDIQWKRAYTREGIVVAEPEPPLVRNHKMVDEGDVLIGTPKSRTEHMRSGTWATIRYARKNDVPIWIVFPDGTIITPFD